ncbi:SGNH/GDSL hydrolase family protein [Latilactobacillus sakei]|uniref:BppU family phage baseplate upper protein n=1 Tax=Latilactobacillus sakei TaxID=1599 RepID=A0AAF0GQ37_LATSK|nr:SGNH/GDSL hydrolase family protein [Latilactobacillus sakei]WGI18549.1 BppU family phage baseplate upper protein [Latilactobacillus sakei]
MAVRTYNLVLDTKETVIPEPIYVRQGDGTGAVVLHVSVVDRGRPVALSGNLQFKAMTADNQNVISDNSNFKDIDLANGKFTYELPNQVTMVPGRVKLAYFQVKETTGEQSLLNITIDVKPAADINPKNAADYIALIESWSKILAGVDPNGTILKEVVEARGNYSNLAGREDDQDNAIAVTNSNLANKADKTYINDYLSQVSYVPETVASLDELKTKYPNGKPGLFVTADNGHKYIWTDGAWKDAGVYQSQGIAKESIGWDMIKQPLTRAVITSGEVKIDVSAKTIAASEDLVLDVNFNFIYVNKESKLAIPETNDPLYYYIDRTTLEYRLDTKSAAKTLTNNSVLIGILYGGMFYSFGGHSDEHVNYVGQKYRPKRNFGEIVYGDLNIDYSNNTIRTATKQTIFSCNGQTKTSNSALAVKIPVDSDQRIAYVYYDFLNDKLICVNVADFLNTNLWYLFAIYNGEIFDATGKHFTFIDRSRLADREPETSPILFDDTYKIVISEADEVGTVHIPAGTCFYVNVNGLYLRIPDQREIEYSNPQSDVNDKGLLTFFYVVETKEIYADYFKRGYADIRLFSVYRGKVYGSNVKAYVVNGIEDGGWSNNENPKRDLIDWYQLATSSGKANIAWLGDSTWEGYRVKNPDNIFPVYLNKLLPNEFNDVKSFNCSKGGYSTKQLYDNYDALTANASDLGLLMIGGGLNDGYDLAGLNESEKYLDLIVKKARKNGLTPVIATTQSTALLYASKATGGDWNKQQSGFDLINKMKRRYAERNNVDLLDLEKYTHDFIENSPASMADMFTDYLHGQDPIHVFEANVAMAYLSQHCDFMEKNQLIGITTMNARSNVPYNKAYQPLGEVEDGFKVKFNYTATDNDVLIDYQLFIPADGNTWHLDGFNAGNTVKVTINGKIYDVTTDGKICELPIGYYHITCTTTAGTVDFKGLKVSYE